MPRPHRIEYKGAWYLIKNYGYDGENIFNDDDDRELFLELLEEVSRIFSIEVYAYALFEDHYCLVIHTPQAQLARAMRHLNGVYTQRFNQTWDYEGPVFQGRYKSLVIDPDKYLTEVVGYVHSAPVDNGYCNKAIDYPWSSHHAYMKERERPEWLKTYKVIKSLGFIRAFAVSKFNKLVNSGISLELENRMEKEHVILGDQRFKDKVKTLNQEQGKQKKVQGSKGQTRAYC